MTSFNVAVIVKNISSRRKLVATAALFKLLEFHLLRLEVVGVLFALATKGDGSFIQKFGDGAVRAGWIGSIIGIIAIFGSEGFASGDMGQIGMALAVCSLTVFYGYLLKLGALILD